MGARPYLEFVFRRGQGADCRLEVRFGDGGQLGDVVGELAVEREGYEGVAETARVDGRRHGGRAARRSPKRRGSRRSSEWRHGESCGWALAALCQSKYSNQSTAERRMMVVQSMSELTRELLSWKLPALLVSRDDDGWLNCNL